MKPAVAYEAQMETARSLGWKIGFANGCFDLLHEGHKTLLRRAKEKCALLVVAVNDDESVRRLKGAGRPIQPLVERMKALREFADIVWSFNSEADLFRLVTETKPDFLFKGVDYMDKGITGGAFLKKNGGKIVLIPLVENVSTTKLVENKR